MANRGFARSMNGNNDLEINEVQFPDGSTITSSANLVQLNTNNNFTAFNTFDVNLPTSTIDPDVVNIGDNTILNKFSADKLYSTTDANDYPTDFVRNGTTGEITLTTATTGTPLNGNTTITSITDAKINQIGTNTTAINTCFDTASITGQNLKFTTVAGTETTIALPPDTDTNDYPTNFARNGTTGAITLTTANTGTALNGDTTINSITDAQITQIGTNTTAINTCFDTASITGQNLKFTTIGGTETTIPLPPDTDTNNFSTNFTRNGTTGAITLTTATTGTPLNGDTTITSITDAKITEIGTNTTAISNLDGQVVKITGTQSISGVKTFNDTPLCNTQPSNNNQLANKEYVDSQTGGGGVTLNTPQNITATKTFTVRQEFNDSIEQTQSGSKIVTQGKVGIGTANPTYPLQVQGQSYFDDYMTFGTNCHIYSSKGNGGLHGKFVNTQSSSDYMELKNSTSGAFNIPMIMWKKGSDNILDCYIGKAGNTEMYIANGNDATDGIRLIAPGGVSASTSWFSASDDRLKHNEKPLPNALENIRKLKGLKYFKTPFNMYPANTDFPLDASGNPIIPPDTSGNAIKWIYEQGFIAQEVLKIDDFKHLVNTNPLNKRDPITNDLIPYDLDYNGLFVNNVVATQQLADKVNELEARIKILENI